jgi:thymidylate kinase
MGVDGAGKSTTIENIKLTLNNEIMYKMHYFGLKTSIINKLRSIFSKEKEIKKIDSGRTKLIQKKKTSIIKKVYFLIIGIFYWIEYNIKYLFYIRLNSITASTVHLIDRSYYDALLYYDIKILDILFFKFSFKPDALIYLTGDTNLLYERKKEISKKEIDFYKLKYESLMKKFTLNQFNIKVLDSTINDEIYIRNIINLEIFEFLKERA